MNRRAFTLVEVLVAIGIIGILIAILAPALRSVRGSARGTICLANLRTAGSDIAALLEAEGEYPFLPADTLLDTSPDGEGVGGISSSSHWGTGRLWPTAMHNVAPWRQHFEAWVCPSSPRAPGEPWRADPDLPVSEWVGTGQSSYALSSSLRADPRTWYPDAVADPALIRPVRAGEVRTPSAKVLLYDAEMAHLGPAPGEAELDSRPIGFVDGHAAILRVSAAIDPQPNPFHDYARRLHDTPLGAHGADY